MNLAARLFSVLACTLLFGCATLSQSGNGSSDAMSLLTRGDAAYRQGDWPLAEQYFRELTQRMPTDALARFKLGNTLVQQHRLEEGAKAYVEALQRDPASAKAANNLATVYLMLAQESLEVALRNLPAGDSSTALLALRRQQIHQIAEIPVEERHGSGKIISIGEAQREDISFNAH